MLLFIQDLQYQVLDLLENAHHQYALMATSRKNWIGCKTWRTNNWNFYGVRLKPYLVELAKKDMPDYRIYVNQEYDADVEMMTLVIAYNLRPCIITARSAFLDKWDLFLKTLNSDIMLIKSDNDIQPNTKDFFDQIISNRKIVIMNPIYIGYLSRIKLIGEINVIDYFPTHKAAKTKNYISSTFFACPNYRLGKLSENIDPIVDYKRLTVISHDHSVNSPISKYLKERIIQNRDKLKKLIVITDYDIKINKCKIYKKSSLITEEDVENSIHDTIITCKSSNMSKCLYPGSVADVFACKNKILFDDIIVIGENRHINSLLEEVKHVSNVRRYISVTYIHTDINEIAQQYIPTCLNFDMDIIYGLTYNMLRLLNIDMSKLSIDDMRLIFREYTFDEWKSCKNVKMLTESQANDLAF